MYTQLKFIKIINLFFKPIKIWIKFLVSVFMALVKPSFKTKIIFKKKIRYSSNLKIKILHLVPKSFATKDPSHGSSKDILNLENHLAKNANIDRLIVLRDKFAIIEIINLLRLNSISIKSYDQILINIPGSPFAIIFFIYFLKSKKTKLLFRAHNAEMLHVLDRISLTPCRLKKFELRIKAFESFIFDLLIAQFVNYIFVISTHDASFYWRKFVKSSKVLHLPYSPVLFEEPIKNLRKNLILSLGATVSGSPFALDQELNFYKFSKEVGPLEKFLFCQVGGQNTEAAPSFIKAYGIVKNLDDFLNRAKVLCICSSFGRGTKTKLADAVANGIPVITTEDIFERTDIEFRNGVIPYGPNSQNKTFKDALLFFLNNCNDFNKSSNKVCDLVSDKINYTLSILSNKHSKYEDLYKKNKDQLCIVSVLYKNDPYIYWNIESCATRNVGSNMTWLLVLNMNQEDAIPLKNKLQIFINNFKNCKLLFLEGVINEIREHGSGSMSHALGLNLAMSYLIENYYKYEFLCITDPDMFILQFKWIRKFSKKLRMSNKFIIGSESDQSIILHDKEKISPHFMFFKSDVKFFSTFDFTPDFLRTTKLKKPLALKFPFQKSRFELLTTKQKIDRLLYLSEIFGKNGDTGSRIKIRKKMILGRLMLLPPCNAGDLKNAIKLHCLINELGFLKYLNLNLFFRMKYLEKLINLEWKFKNYKLIEAFEVFIGTESLDYSRAVHIHNTNKLLFLRSPLEFETLVKKGVDIRDPHISKL
jgi:hypothetical protein